MLDSRDRGPNLDTGVSAVDVSLERLLPRVDSRALGAAIGVLLGVALFLFTILHAALDLIGLPLGLLDQYFYGYEVSWTGAVAGLAWGFGAGFIGGWLLGAIHNATMSVWMMLVRSKADLSQKRDVLDQIR